MHSPTRRQALAAGAGLLTGLAGCSGGSGDGGADTPTEGVLPAPVAGDPGADVTVQSFEDFACPHCKTFSLEVWPKLTRDYLSAGTVRYEWYDFPIPVDEQVSWQAASAARAVQTGSGNQAFYTYAERLFENQSRLGPDAYAQLTEGLDVEGERVRTAATEEHFRATAEANKQTGLDMGVQGTPAVFVDGEQVQMDEVAYEPVKQAIEAARGQ